MSEILCCAFANIWQNVFYLFPIETWSNGSDTEKAWHAVPSKRLLISRIAWANLAVASGIPPAMAETLKNRFFRRRDNVENYG